MVVSVQIKRNAPQDGIAPHTMPQQISQHRRSRCLAMRASHCQSGIVPANHPQNLSPFQNRDFPAVNLRPLSMILRNSRCIDNHIRISRKFFRIFVIMDFRSCLFQMPRQRRRDPIVTVHQTAFPQVIPSQGAHSDAAYSQKVRMLEISCVHHLLVLAVFLLPTAYLGKFQYLIHNIARGSRRPHAGNVLRKKLSPASIMIQSHNSLAKFLGHPVVGQ